MQQNVYSFALNFGMWPWRAIGVDNVGLRNAFKTFCSLR